MKSCSTSGRGLRKDLMTSIKWHHRTNHPHCAIKNENCQRSYRVGVWDFKCLQTHAQAATNNPEPFHFNKSKNSGPSEKLFGTRRKAVLFSTAHAGGVLQSSEWEIWERNLEMRKAFPKKECGTISIFICYRGETVRVFYDEISL